MSIYVEYLEAEVERLRAKLETETKKFEAHKRRVERLESTHRRRTMNSALALRRQVEEIKQELTDERRQRIADLEATRAESEEVSGQESRLIDIRQAITELRHALSQKGSL